MSNNKQFQKKRALNRILVEGFVMICLVLVLMGVVSNLSFDRQILGYISIVVVSLFEAYRQWKSKIYWYAWFFIIIAAYACLFTYDSLHQL